MDTLQDMQTLTLDAPQIGSDMLVDSERGDPVEPVRGVDEALAAAVGRLLTDPAAASDQARRQAEALALMGADGRDPSDIAAELVLSEKTVERHRTNILAKLQVSNRREAMLRYREH